MLIQKIFLVIGENTSLKNIQYLSYFGIKKKKEEEEKSEKVFRKAEVKRKGREII